VKMLKIGHLNGATSMCEHSTGARFLVIMLLLIASFVPSQAEEYSADYWIGLGMELEGSGLYEEAVKAYDEAAMMDQENATIWFFKGNALYFQAIAAGFDTNLFKDALKAYDQAISLNDSYALPWWGKSRAFNLMASRQSGEEREKTSSDALDAIEMAVRIDPSAVDAWLSRALFLMRWRYPRETSAGTMTPSRPSIWSFRLHSRTIPETSPWPGTARRSALLTWPMILHRRRP